MTCVVWRWGCSRLVDLRWGIYLAESVLLVNWRVVDVVVLLRHVLLEAVWVRASERLAWGLQIARVVCSLSWRNQWLSWSILILSHLIGNTLLGRVSKLAHWICVRFLQLLTLVINEVLFLLTHGCLVVGHFIGKRRSSPWGRSLVFHHGVTVRIWVVEILLGPNLHWVQILRLLMIWCLSDVSARLWSNNVGTNMRNMISVRIIFDHLFCLRRVGYSFCGNACWRVLLNLCWKNVGSLFERSQVTVIIPSFSTINNAFPPDFLEVSTVARSQTTLAGRALLLLLLIYGTLVVVSEGGTLIVAEVDWSDKIIGPQIDAPNL